MRFLIVLLVLTGIFQGCGDHNNKKTSTQVNQTTPKIELSKHKDLKILSQSIPCQEILKEKMKAGLSLVNAPGEFDDINVTMNAILKKKENKKQYIAITNDSNQVELMGMQTEWVIPGFTLDFQQAFTYIDNQLLLMVGADLYSIDQNKKSIPEFQTTQIYRVNGNCSLDFIRQTVVHAAVSNNKTELTATEYVASTQEIEETNYESSEEMKYWDVDPIQLRDDKIEAKHIYYEDNANLWLDIYQKKAQKREKKLIFNPVVKKDVEFEVDSIKVLRGGKFQCEIVIESSNSSDYVIIKDLCSNNSSEHWMGYDTWKTLSVEVMDSSDNQSVTGFTDHDFNTSTKFKMTTRQQIKSISNLNEYFESFKEVQSFEKGKYEYVLTSRYNPEVTKDMFKDFALSLDDQENIKGTNYIDVKSQEVKDLVKKVGMKEPKSRMEEVEAILQVVNETITYDEDMINDLTNRSLKSSEIIKRKKGVCHHFSNVFTAIARSLQIPTRIIGGFTIKDKIGPHAWVEVKISADRWLPIEPQNKELSGLSGSIYFPTGELSYYEDKAVDYNVELNERLFYQSIKIEKL